jgi:hypothetical protein
MSRRHGRATLPFGKHRGVRVSLCDDAYLSWLSGYDEGWDAEGCVIPVFEDEWEVLRTLPDVKMEPIIGKDKRIEEGKKKK